MKNKKTNVSIKALCAMSALCYFACAKPATTDGLGNIPNVKNETTTKNNVSALRDWDVFIGQYQLVSFNGKLVPAQYAEIQSTISSYYDKAKHNYVDGLLFPLFYDVSASSASKYIFGPFNTDGAFTQLTNSQDTTYYFSYTGPINFQGIDLQLSLTISCLQKNNLLYVDYEIDIPNEIKKTKNSLVFKRQLN